MWRRVDLVWTDISEEHIAYIFRVEKSSSEEPAGAGGRFFYPENVLPKCRFTQDLHCATSHKTAFFIVTAVRTSNLTNRILFQPIFEVGTLKMQRRNVTASDVFGEILSVFKFKSKKIFRYFHSRGIYSKNGSAERQHHSQRTKKAQVGGYF
jgi:hypothetical protein